MVNTAPGPDERNINIWDGLKQCFLLIETKSISVWETILYVQEVGGQAEGYDAADLRVLADRALHAAARRHLASGSGATRQSPRALVVSSTDLAEAQQGFQPAAAWGVGHLQVPCCPLYTPLDAAFHPAVFKTESSGTTRLCLTPDELEAL